jgi:DNA-directed RNA polymerase specialized sigma24 family protein
MACHGEPMDDAVKRLPRAYAEFLRLCGEGLADALIAERLDVPVEALPLLARLAEAKLAHLRGGVDHGGTETLADPPAPA